MNNTNYKTYNIPSGINERVEKLCEQILNTTGISVKPVELVKDILMETLPIKEREPSARIISPINTILCARYFTTVLKEGNAGHQPTANEWNNALIGYIATFGMKWSDFCAAKSQIEGIVSTMCILEGWEMPILSIEKNEIGGN